VSAAGGAADASERGGNVIDTSARDPKRANGEAPSCKRDRGLCVYNHQEFGRLNWRLLDMRGRILFAPIVQIFRNAV
jgi:hypothetical protein